MASEKAKLDDFFAKKDAKKKTFKFKSNTLNLSAHATHIDENVEENETGEEVYADTGTVQVKKFEKRVQGVFEKKEDDGWVEEEELRQPVIKTGGRQVEELKRDEPEEEVVFDENPAPVGKTWDMDAVETEDAPAPAPQAQEKGKTSLEMLMERRYGGAKKQNFEMNHAQFPTLGGGDAPANRGGNPNTGVNKGKPAAVHMNMYSTLQEEKRGSWAERMETDE